jgi:IclR family pca regulon transcriptional regulator
VSEPTQPRESTFVQSLDRGLAVIRAFDRDHSRLTLSDVARRADLSRAAARRFLLTLERIGYVRVDGREFSLRPRVLELGYAYMSGLTLAEVAQPHVEAFVAGVHESSSLCVLDGDEVVYVVRVPTRRIMSVVIAVGTRFPAYATSMGRVLLAALPEDQLESYLSRVQMQPLGPQTITDPDQLHAELVQVQQQGFALVDEELEEGLRSAAAPVRNAQGDVVAALNVSVHTSRTSMKRLRDEFLPPLLATAQQISAELAHGGPRPQRP